MQGTQQRTPRDEVLATLDEQGRSMTWLAERVGVNRGNLYSMLSGERGITEEIVTKIVRLLGVPRHLLFAGEELLTFTDSGTARTGDSDQEPAA